MDSKNTISDEHDNFLFWKVGTEPPNGFPSDAFLSCLVPRPLAWVCVYEGISSGEEVGVTPRVCLLEGYNGASDRPPTIMFASAALPYAFVESLRSSSSCGGGYCSLSVVTVRDRETLLRLESLKNPQHNNAPVSYTLEDLGLEPQNVPSSLLSYDEMEFISLSTNNNKRTNTTTNDWKRRPKRPPGIKSSPIQMHCKLVLDMELTFPRHITTDKKSKQIYDGTTDPRNHPKQSIIMLEIEHFFIRGDILRRQPSVPRQTVIYTHDNPDVRKISAKIEADLVQPVCSLGNGKYGKLEDDGIYHMCRPRLLRSHNGSNTNSTTVTAATNQTGGIWIVDTLRKVQLINTKSTSTISSTGSSLADVEYNYRNEPYCKLGYNPTKQIVAPRPIGWLSTYSSKIHAEEKEEKGEGKSNSDIQKIAHIAPYSFFIDVGRGTETSMVAFIACLREDDEDNDDDTSFQLLKSQQVTPAIAGSHVSNHYNTNNNNNKKDAHRDSEETGVFAWNMVSKDLAVEMNYSAAEVNRIESEFEMAKLSHIPARTIDAPIVPSSPVIFECTYVTTLLVPRSKPSVERQWYCIIGHVSAIQIRKDVLVPTKNLLSLSPTKEEQEVENTDATILNIEKIKPVARLGYEQEYGVMVPFLTNYGERYNNIVDS